MSQIKRTLMVSSFAVILTAGLAACDNGGGQSQKPKPAVQKNQHNYPMNSQPKKRSGQYGSQSQSMDG